MPAEGNFRKRVLAYLRPYEVAGRITVITVQNVSVRGVSDILLCVRGSFWAVELKAEDGKPSALQEHFLSKVEKSGGKSFLLYPKDFENFKQAIKEATQ